MHIKKRVLGMSSYTRCRIFVTVTLSVAFLLRNPRRSGYAFQCVIVTHTRFLDPCMQRYNKTRFHSGFGSDINWFQFPTRSHWLGVKFLSSDSFRIFLACFPLNTFIFLPYLPLIYFRIPTKYYNFYLS